MNHLYHLQKNKDILEFRFHLIRLIREWFWAEGFMEVETPLIVRLPGQEPYLNPMKLTVHDPSSLARLASFAEASEKRGEYQAYLHTSPEYTMKKMLAADWEKIFSLGKVFRDRESFGGMHNPEFTLLEWYRSRTDFWELMRDVEKLFQYLQKRVMSNEQGVMSENLGQKHKSLPITHYSFQKIHMRDLWREYVGVNLDDYLGFESMAKLCASHYSLPITSAGGGSAFGGHYASYEDAFYKIFLNEIEPKLIAPTIVHHYPAPMAALAKLSESEPGYAERFEVYVNGVELANAFTELTDAEEQLERLEKEKRQREKLGKEVFDIDMEFIDALRHMPPAAGIALGVDRLVQVLTGCQEMDDVITLPMSKLYG